MLSSLWIDITRRNIAVELVALLRFREIQVSDLGLYTAYSKAYIYLLPSLYADYLHYAITVSLHILSN